VIENGGDDGVLPGEVELCPPGAKLVTMADESGESFAARKAS